MSATIATALVNPYIKFTDENGDPLAGGFATLYIAGTDTEITTYVDENLNAQNTSPITLDSSGGAIIFLDPSNSTNECISVKLLLQTSEGVTVPGYPQDGIPVFVPAAGAYASGVFAYGSPTTLTINGGAITPTQQSHMLAPEGGSPDDLVTISTSGLPDGSSLILGNSNGSAAITIKTGTGNIFLAGGDYVISTTTQRIQLTRKGPSWYGLDRQAGVGDFVGPSSSTDNAFVRFDGPTGKLGQNSKTTETDAGLVAVVAGTGSQTATVGGPIAYTVTPVGNSGSGETTLWDVTVQANTLAVNGDGLALRAAGTGDTSGDTKTLRLYWNGVQLFAVALDTTFGSWTVDSNILRSGATSQAISWTEIGLGEGVAGVATGAATLSGAVHLKLTGQGASSNQVVLTQGLLSWLPHPA